MNINNAMIRKLHRIVLLSDRPKSTLHYLVIKARYLQIGHRIESTHVQGLQIRVHLLNLHIKEVEFETINTARYNSSAR
jgi:hypothetical protein